MVIAPQATVQTFDLEAGDTRAVDQVSVLPSVAVEPPIEESFDPVKADSDARRNIAYALLALLVLVVVIALAAISVVNGQPLDSGNATTYADDAKADSDRLTVVLNIVFGPVVTLLGTATGFYFGSQAKSAGGSGD